MIKRTAFASFTAAVLLYIGCVQIPNKFEARIYIDIRHIQQQADQALDYVEGKTDSLPELAPAPEQSSYLRDAVEFLNPIRVAYAQDLEEGSARAAQILKSMRERHTELEKIRATGAVGENNRGLVELVYPDTIEDAEKKNEVQRVIAAENEDRKAYYQEIARLNRGQNLAVGVVESVYAQRRLMRAQPGELFQLPPPGEDFDAFKNSALGTRQGDAAKPNAWIVIK